MHTRILTTVLLLLLAQAISRAAQVPRSSAIPGDTLKLYEIPPVIVTASRLSTEDRRASASQTVLRREEMDRSNGRSLADLLAGSGGMFVKDYGGSGGLKTISERGLGAEHTLVLLNGFRQTGFQNGLVDLGLYPTDLLESVEVIRGGQSSQFGADAVTGVINMVSSARQARTALTAGIGSFGARLLRAAGGISSDAVAVAGSFEEETGSDDFPFVFTNGNLRYDLQRTNADLLTRTGTLQADYSGGGARIMAFGRAQASERGVSGPVVSPTSASRARQEDHDRILQLLVQNGADATTSLSFGGQVHEADERYVDPDLVIAGLPLESSFEILDLRGLATVARRLDGSTRISIGAEVARTRSSGLSVGEERLRSELGVHATGEIDAPWAGTCVSGLVLLPALRFDATSFATPFLSPKMGMAASFRPISLWGVVAMKATVRGSVSRNFRLPTFNELFYRGGGGIGNPSLRPEQAVNADLGTTLLLDAPWSQRITCSYFIVDMEDRIAWLPAGTATVTPKNLERVRSSGVEFEYQLATPGELLTLRANYTGLRSVKTSEDGPGDPTADKQLVYIPQQSFGMAATVTKSFDASIVSLLGASVTFQAVGFRYTSPENTSFLPSYRLLSANVSARMSLLGFIAAAKLEGMNLLAEEYEVVVSYPMPLRTFRFTLTLALPS